MATALCPGPIHCRANHPVESGKLDPNRNYAEKLPADGLHSPGLDSSDHQPRRPDLICAQQSFFNIIWAIEVRSKHLASKCSNEPAGPQSTERVSGNRKRVGNLGAFTA